MSIMLDVIRILLFVMIMRSVMGFFLRQLRGANKVNTDKENSYQSQQQQNTTQEEQEKEEPIQMVKDTLCGKYIQIDKAYQVVTNENQTLYFCSWDCRQKYIENSNL